MLLIAIYIKTVDLRSHGSRNRVKIELGFRKSLSGFFFQRLHLEQNNNGKISQVKINTMYSN